MRTVAAGSTTCTETTPGNCKVVNYPRTMAATGRVCGNTVSIDVLINGGFGVGLPIRNQLYNVTAFSFGRNDANDLYAGRQPPCDLALGDLHAEPLCGLLQLGAVGEQAEQLVADLLELRAAVFREGLALGLRFGAEVLDQRVELLRRDLVAADRRSGLVGPAAAAGEQRDADRACGERLHRSGRRLRSCQRPSSSSMKRLAATTRSRIGSCGSTSAAIESSKLGSSDSATVRCGITVSCAPS